MTVLQEAESLAVGAVKAAIPSFTIPKAYLFGAALIVAFGMFLAIAASYRSAYTKGMTAGADGCRAEVAANASEQMAKAQKGILDAQKQLQDEEDRINASGPGGNGPIAPVIRDQLVRLRGAAPKRRPFWTSNPAPFHP